MNYCGIELHKVNTELAEWINELQLDILARNADVGDLQHDCHVAVMCELMNMHPNMRYIRRLLCDALRKPFTAMH